MINPFKKKTTDVLDLTSNRQTKQEIPIPQDIKTRIEADIAKSSVSARNNSSDSEVITIEPKKETTPSSSSSSGGGFFGGFFGGSSSNKDTTPEPSYSSTISTSSASSKQVEDLKDSLQSANARISRLIDRVELLERKMDRLEGK